MKIDKIRIKIILIFLLGFTTLFNLISYIVKGHLFNLITTIAIGSFFIFYTSIFLIVLFAEEPKSYTIEEIIQMRNEEKMKVTEKELDSLELNKNE